jgi:dUTP pyrophosphatase
MSCINHKLQNYIKLDEGDEKLCDTINTVEYCKISCRNIEYGVLDNGQIVVKNCPLDYIVVKIKKLHKDAKIPKYETTLSAGFDFYSVEDVVIQPHETKLVKTGLSIELIPGYELQVRPRSGLSLKTDIRIANSPGTVDADYRGEVGIIVWNTGDDEIKIEKGMRIAQGIINKVERVEFIVVDELSDTKRGSGGFGSTGIK